MTRNEIIESAVKLTQDHPGNYISEEIALKPEYAGVKMFDDPIFGFGSADDGIYMKYKSPMVISDQHLTPQEWLPGAKTVISFFVPFSDRVKSSNAEDYDWPSDEWLHARVEGQVYVKELTLFITKLLIDAGYNSVAPAFDERFKMGKTADGAFFSNWSERHAAYACGLGTFGLSKGIITEKGTAGRFGSVITELDLPKSERHYSDVYEYCTECGICVRHCPPKAISIEKGKENKPCSDFLDQILEKHKPRYGCGKCQVNVPCESGIPKKN